MNLRETHISHTCVFQGDNDKLHNLLEIYLLALSTSTLLEIVSNEMAKEKYRKIREQSRRIIQPLERQLKEHFKFFTQVVGFFVMIIVFC